MLQQKCGGYIGYKMQKMLFCTTGYYFKMIRIEQYYHLIINDNDNNNPVAQF